MCSQQTTEQIPRQPHRDRCYGCFRPRRDCFCDTIPTIDNRTELLIVQHVRERFHPFNTARIVQKALCNSRLVVDHTSRLADRLDLKSRAALLYPGPTAQLIEDVPAADRPDQLVVLDGTWHHAKTLLREIPALGQLPRYRLAPSAPGQYRIRREPTATALSTIEAIVAALRVFEPETLGFERLIESFQGMVERQLGHPKAQYGWRSNARRGRTVRNIPIELVENLHNIVVAYGESTPGVRGCKRKTQAPVYWVAERLGTGERLECAIQTDAPLSDSFLGHLDLSRGAFAAAWSLSEVRAAWANFLRPTDTLAVYNQGTVRLLDVISTSPADCLVLQSVDLDRRDRYRTLEELVEGEGFFGAATKEYPCRASRRLAYAAALARHMHAIGIANRPLAQRVETAIQHDC